MPICRLLVVNRSEIAICVFRAASELGIGTITIYADEHKLSLQRFKADEAYLIGRGPHLAKPLGPLEAYLSIPEVVRFERDCSIQRRNQKVIERAPAPYLAEEQRPAFCQAALRIGHATSYIGARTVEFLMDAETGKFYFIEFNPRIEVEHTVTEVLTGLDLVKA